MSPASLRERAFVAAAFAVLALLRLATLAPDPWEWDEVLFMEGVRDGLDVRVNHPHAPGYPVFIRLGQGIRALGVEPFRATALAAGVRPQVGLALLPALEWLRAAEAGESPRLLPPCSSSRRSRLSARLRSWRSRHARVRPST